MDTLVEAVKRLSGQEKEALRDILEEVMLDERRNEIHKHYRESLKELRGGAIEFSGDQKDLRRMLDE